DNIDHHILIKLLKRKIKDEKFINLIWKFLRAGYLEDWKFNNTYSGTPQGGIISPILSNIYLNELDKYIEEYKTLFDKGTRRQNNIVYTQKYKRLWYLKKKFADRKV
ncbi:reverse transcriptase/maturase family protein, partial [Bacillus cereus]